MLAESDGAFSSSAVKVSTKVLFRLAAFGLARAQWLGKTLGILRMQDGTPDLFALVTRMQHVWGLILTVFFASLAWSQGVTAVMSGIVAHPGAVLSGALVIVTNADTGVVVWTGKTNFAGVYRAPNLPPGRYDVAATAEGFRREQVSGIELPVSGRVDVPITMEVGEITQTLTVEGRTQNQLETDSSSLGNTITGSQLRNLPLPSRNTLNLLALTPGLSSGGDITAQAGLNTSQLSIDGSRTLNSEFLIDGISVVSGSTGAVQTLPPADSILEFNVLAVSYSAEYGRSSGATVALVTNSGSGVIHGGAYGYFRNEDMDANNYFNNVVKKPRPEDRYNVFGGRLSGPLVFSRARRKEARFSS
jgi:hypothetical protein